MINLAQLEIVYHYFEYSDLTYLQIADKAKLSIRTIHRIIHSTYLPERIGLRKQKTYSNSKLRAKNPRYGKRFVSLEEVEDGYGYLLAVKPKWYTGRVKSKHIFAHHLVMCQALGRTEIPKGWCVHHVDFNKKNNHINNLALMTVSAHAKLHQQNMPESINELIVSRF